MISTRSTTRTARLGSLLAALALASLSAAPQARAEGEVAAAKATMQHTVDDTLSVLNDKSLSKDARKAKLETIAVDSFDFGRMAQLVLGKNRTSLSADQQQQFLDEFKKHLSLTYGTTFDRYTGSEKIALDGGRLEGNKDVTLRMSISGGSAPPDGVRIDYRLRIDDDKWLVIDVIPEGVSLIQNFRSQVQEIVTQKGVANLIQTLHDKNASQAQGQTPS
ncbi:MAG TPA: ABC transporter substrate-binding protein [Myxococcota bacterium]|nr:ABC transporter substrate-binding protein [Myxococcota bacterium]